MRYHFKITQTCELKFTYFAPQHRRALCSGFVVRKHVKFNLILRGRLQQNDIHRLGERGNVKFWRAGYCRRCGKKHRLTIINHILSFSCQRNMFGTLMRWRRTSHSRSLQLTTLETKIMTVLITTAKHTNFKLISLPIQSILLLQVRGTRNLLSAKTIKTFVEKRKLELRSFLRPDEKKGKEIQKCHRVLVTVIQLHEHIFHPNGFSCR